MDQMDKMDPMDFSALLRPCGQSGPLSPLKNLFVHSPTVAIPVLFNSGFLFLYFPRLLFPTVAPLCSSTEKRKNGDFSQIFSIFCLTILQAGVYYMTTVRDIAQPGLARLTGGQKVRSSNLRIPTIFFAFSTVCDRNS